MKSFIDIFKKSFLEGSATQISFPGVVIVMALAMLVAAYIYLIYKKFYCGVIYSHNFNVAISMMAVISSMIIATISSNVTLSLGMVGALSIIRFRTAIKDPIDLIFLFWAVAAGIAVGARLWIVVVIGNLCVGLFFILLSRGRRKTKTYLLVIGFADASFAQVNEILTGFHYILRSKVSKRGVTEMTVELNLKDQNTQFSEKLTAVSGVNSVALVSYNGDFAQ